MFSDVGVALCGISPGLTLYTEYVNKFNEASTTLRKFESRNSADCVCLTPPLCLKKKKVDS